MDPNLSTGDRFALGAGQLVGTLAALESLRTPGGFGRFLLSRATAAQEPDTRLALAQSPFLTGFLGYGGTRLPVSHPGEAEYAGLPPSAGVQVLGPSPTFGGLPTPAQPTQFAPSLPVLGPTGRTQLAQASLQESQAGIQQLHSAILAKLAQGQPLTPQEATVARALKLSQPTTAEQLAEVEAFRQAYPKPAGMLESLTFAPGRGASVSYREPQPLLGGVDPAFLAQFGIVPPAAPAAAPTPAPAAPAPGTEAAPPGAPPAVALPKGFVPYDPNAADLDEPLDATVGYPSPAFPPDADVAYREGISAAAGGPGPRLGPGWRPGQAPAPGVGIPIAAPAAAPPVAAPAAAPNLRVKGVTLGPRGVQGVTLAPPGGGKEDFTIAARAKALQVLTTAKGAITRLRDRGVLTDDVLPSTVGRNRLYLEAAARGRTPSGGNVDDQTQKDATFLLRNLASTVPALARGFGEQRTNIQEEQRLRDALSFNFVPASMAESVIDNYIALFQPEGAATTTTTTTLPPMGRFLGFRPAGR